MEAQSGSTGLAGSHTGCRLGRVKVRIGFRLAFVSAAVAHGEHEKRTGGQRDENWPDWYAEYMVAEQAGKPLPT